MSRINLNPCSRVAGFIVCARDAYSLPAVAKTIASYDTLPICRQALGVNVRIVDLFAPSHVSHNNLAVWRCPGLDIYRKRVNSIVIVDQHIVMYRSIGARAIIEKHGRACALWIKGHIPYEEKL